MRLLLDTVTLIWLARGHSNLTSSVRAAYEDRSNELVVSVVSMWEILLKVQAGKLQLESDIGSLVRPYRVLPLAESAVLRLHTLPDLHRDPFDRVLVCQALDEGLILVTPDAVLHQYPIATLW